MNKIIFVSLFAYFIIMINGYVVRPDNLAEIGQKNHGPSRSQVQIYVEEDMSKMVIFNMDYMGRIQHCSMFGETRTILTLWEFVRNQIAIDNIIVTDSDTIQAKFTECLNSKKSPGSQDLIYRLSSDLLSWFTGFKSYFSIFPGTKWCGAGNIAANYSDLGVLVMTDLCCRDHDFCPESIAVGETVHNLTNNDHFSKLSCECDKKLHDCLQEAEKVEPSAKYVGDLYFNVLMTQCYEFNYPLVGCSRDAWQIPMVRAKCIDHKYDKTKPKEYHFIDTPMYKSEGLKSVM